MPMLTIPSGLAGPPDDDDELPVPQAASAKARTADTATAAVSLRECMSLSLINAHTADGRRGSPRVHSPASLRRTSVRSWTYRKYAACRYDTGSDLGFWRRGVIRPATRGIGL